MLLTSLKICFCLLTLALLIILISILSATLPRSSEGAKGSRIPLPRSSEGDKGRCRANILHLEYLDSSNLSSIIKQLPKEFCGRAVCQFMNGTGRLAVPLLSFPGSGNTWLRGLLEKASGICTGSVYHDKSLISQGLVGEGVRNGAVIVVKAHSLQVLASKKIDFHSSVHLIRNPFKAIVAERNRRFNRNHTGVIMNQHLFTTNTLWSKFVARAAKRWSQMNQEIITQSMSKRKFNMVIVRFEDIQSDRVREITRILSFLNISYSTSEVMSNLKDDFSVFKRAPAKSPSDHFTVQQTKLVNTAIRKVISTIRKYYNTDFNLTDYLRT